MEVVKQEMARVNVDILGISKLKWTGMGEFKSDDHYIYDCGQESLRRNGVAHHGQQKSQKCSTWMQSQKRQNDLCLFPRQTNITVIQIYAPTSNAEGPEVERFCEDLQDLLELTPKKKSPFHHRGLECKIGGNEISGVTVKFSLGVKTEAVQRLTDFCKENALVIVNTLFQQNKR